MTDARPILLGMNNPLSSEPRYALFPHPTGCTGWRILELIRTRVPSATGAQYISRFDRRNLLSARSWSAREARDAAAKFLERESELRDRTVVVFGNEVRRLLGLERSGRPIVRNGVTYVQLPHPSGRCRWYNESRNASAASRILADLFLAAEERQS